MHKQIAKRANEKNLSRTDLYVASLHTIREACNIQLNEGQRRNEREGENIREIGLGCGISASSQIQQLDLTQRLKNLMRAISSSGRNGLNHRQSDAMHHLLPQKRGQIDRQIDPGSLKHSQGSYSDSLSLNEPLCISFVSPDVRLLRGSVGQREATLQLQYRCPSFVCVSVNLPFSFTLFLFQFSLSVSQFPLFMKLSVLYELLVAVGALLARWLHRRAVFLSPDQEPLLKGRGRKEKQAKTDAAVQCSGDCEFCAVDEYNLQTVDHAHILSSFRSYSHSPESFRDRNTQVPPIPPVMRSAVISGYSSALLLPRAR